MPCTYLSSPLSRATNNLFIIISSCRDIAKQSFQILLAVVVILFISTTAELAAVINFIVVTEDYSWGYYQSHMVSAFLIDKCTPTATLLVNV